MRKVVQTVVHAVKGVAAALTPPSMLAQIAEFPLGISAMVRVKDEEDWVYPSLCSVAPYVDEVVVVDASTDGSWARIGWYFYVPVLNLEGDLQHMHRHVPWNAEARAYVNWAGLHYRASRGWEGAADSLEAVAKVFTNCYLRNTVMPYDEARYGPLPPLCATGERYRIVYDDAGHVLGRNDCL